MDSDYVLLNYGRRVCGTSGNDDKLTEHTSRRTWHDIHHVSRLLSVRSLLQSNIDFPPELNSKR